jgi:hypothetical protein
MDSLGFAMRPVTPAKAAIFLQLEPLAVVLAVLRGVVVAPLALVAGQYGHHTILFFRHLFAVSPDDIKKTDARPFQRPS